MIAAVRRLKLAWNIVPPQGWWSGMARTMGPWQTP
jgi:hypothetical protein